MACWWTTTCKPSGPQLFILISANKENIIEIEKNVMQLGHRFQCILKMGYMPKKIEKYSLRGTYCKNRSIFYLGPYS